ncbi:MAG: class II fumarate hydratase [Spirochaetaceae bacterium]|nr:MAG: class II fumarate hydratase [Spirochaetaceae bacterium]
MPNAAQRTESDSMGEVRIPQWAYWGAQTQRAMENFAVSSLRIPTAMIRSLALVKKHAARTNAELGLVEQRLADAIVQAADEMLDGKWDEHFPIDVFQTGSGTSWNMNANEVLANRANEILGQPRGTRAPVHPNDHVNRSQSSNDVIPTALHIADRMVADELLTAMQLLQQSLAAKADEFKDLVKLGRTHLQDAVPMTLGQEFSGYATQIEKNIQRVSNTLAHLEELALGGTAVGTGINCHPEFAERAITGIAAETGIAFRPADNRFEAIAARDAQVELMGALNVLATGIMKIGNDLRLLASGPRGALGEILLPSLQPGSSIMPGKVNPVIPEMMIQVAAYVMGKVVSVTSAGQNGPLELNMMHPLIAFETIDAMSVLAQTCRRSAERCIDGISADSERLAFWIEWSLALVTPLAIEIGYDRASELAYKAYREKRRIREVVLESGVLPQERVAELLDARGMI